MSKAQQHDEAIRTLLGCGDDPDIQEGFELIDRHFRVPVCGWLKSSYYPAISPEDLADVWQETLLDLHKQVQAKNYDGCRPVFADLCRLIKTNAIDQRRRHQVRETLLHTIAMVLKNTQTGQKWQQTNPAERHEILKLIRDAAMHFSDRQEIVFEAYLGNLPESYSMQELRRFVSELTGVEETLAAVKGSLREVRRKLRGVLRRKGYTYAGDDDE